MKIQIFNLVLNFKLKINKYWVVKKPDMERKDMA
jgi:hypothetical protein